MLGHRSCSLLNQNEVSVASACLAASGGLESVQYQTIGGNPLPSSPPSWLPPFSPTLPRCLPWAPATALAALSTAPGGLCRPGRNQTRLSRTPGMDGAVGFVTVTRPHAFDGPSALLRSSGTLCRNSPLFRSPGPWPPITVRRYFSKERALFQCSLEPQPWLRSLSAAWSWFRKHHSRCGASPRKPASAPHAGRAPRTTDCNVLPNLIASAIGYSAPHSIRSVSGSPAESRRASPSQ